MNSTPTIHDNKGIRNTNPFNMDHSNLSSNKNQTNHCLSNMPSISNIDIWTQQCKLALLQTETVNIEKRAKNWNTLIAEQTKGINSYLNINNGNLIQYEFKINDVSEHLQFIKEWKGLCMKQLQVIPTTYDEFAEKGQSWVNGRRATNYAKTLFPKMIQSVEQFAENLANQVFGANDGDYNKQLYQLVLMSGYLYTLCSARFHDSNRAFLLPDNSIKAKKSETAQLLQKYAVDHPYPEHFPAHRKEATDYFEEKHEKSLTELKKYLSPSSNHHKNDIAKESEHDIAMNNNEVNSGLQLPSNMNRSNFVFVPIEYLQKLMSEIQNVKRLQQQQNSYIVHLHKKVAYLESKINGYNNNNNMVINNINHNIMNHMNNGYFVNNSANNNNVTQTDMLRSVPQTTDYNNSNVAVVPSISNEDQQSQSAFSQIYPHNANHQQL